MSIECQEGFAEVNGGKIYYKIYQSSEGTSTPLILVHGGPGFTHRYLEPLYVLANERPVILYDQLGCGQSDRPKDLSYCNVKRFVSELGDLIKHLKLDKVTLLGHSWGSTVVGEYAASNLNVSHLIFASPYLSSEQWNLDVEFYKNKLPSHLKIALGDVNNPDFFKAHEEYYTRHVYGAARNDRSIQLATEEASAEVYNTMWGSDEYSIKGVLKDFNITDKLKNITAKTLFIAGENDTGSPRACRIIAAKMKNAPVVSLKGLAHFPHLENKSEYLGLLRNFLNDQTRMKKRLLKGIFNFFN